jgi:hypothetical protein
MAYVKETMHNRMCKYARRARRTAVAFFAIGVAAVTGSGCYTQVLHNANFYVRGEVHSAADDKPLDRVTVTFIDVDLNEFPGYKEVLGKTNAEGKVEARTAYQWTRKDFTLFGKKPGGSIMLEFAKQGFEAQKRSFRLQTLPEKEKGYDVQFDKVTLNRTIAVYR